MTDKNKTLIVALLDRTGSMYSIKTDVEGAFDAFIKTQREAGLDDQVYVSLYQFDHVDPREVIYEHVPIADVAPCAIQPRGNTPLHDAIGYTITHVGEQLASLSDDQRPARVYFVIATDGKENWSKEWTKEQVRELVDRQTNEWNWQFHFIGVGIDAYEVGEGYGVPRMNTNSTPRSKSGQTYATTSASIVTHRSKT